MKKILATAVLALALIGSAFAATLKPYTSPKGDFTISTPAPFTVSEKTQKSESGDTYTTAIYSATEKNGDVLMVGTAVYPFAVTEDALSASARGAISELRGDLRKVFSYKGGDVFIASVPSGQVLVYAKAVGNEAYLVIFYAPTDEVATTGDEVANIVDSFTPTSTK